MIGLYFGSVAVLYLFLRLWWLAKDKPAGKWYFAVTSLIFTFILFEIAANIVLYKQSGSWVFAEDVSHNAKLWEEHPTLVGVNKKSVALYLDGHNYTHNSQGYRGDSTEAIAGKKMVLAIGGSTPLGGWCKRQRDLSLLIGIACWGLITK